MSVKFSELGELFIKNKNRNGECFCFILDDAVQGLLRSAAAVRELAYCPYSKFQVGAAVLCADGTTYTGCNIENASYTVGICAERTAYCKAISEGRQNFEAVAVVAYQKNFITTPCGACRQFLSEFGDVRIYLSKPQLDDVMVTSLGELLPHSFQKNHDHTF